VDIKAVFYERKAVTLATQMTKYGILIGAGVLILIHFMYLPSATQWLKDKYISPFLGVFNKHLPKEILHSFKNKTVLLAGVAVGLTTAIRIVGPVAAGLVGLYFLLKAKGKAVAPSFSYLTTAAITVYLTWPYLWADPFSRVAEIWRLNSKFPFSGLVLFGGELIPANELPRTFLPTLISFQFTETVLILAGVGLILTFINLKKNLFAWEKFFFLSSWFFIPFILIIITQPNLYDNFRQLLFITPPLLIFTGLALEKIYKSVSSKASFVLALAIVLFPAITANIELHPYQYIYYNQFAGGVQGAYRHYELDYWGTSFQEAMGFVNDTAEPNAKVAVWGPAKIAAGYAREDLKVEAPGKARVSNYDYGLLLTRNNRDVYNIPRAPLLFSITRDGAVLSVVKKIQRP
ncbi:MAG: hypothetical protein N2D54_06165, partial [Chloroflexota bacterium]